MEPCPAEPPVCAQMKLGAGAFASNPGKRIKPQLYPNTLLSAGAVSPAWQSSPGCMQTTLVILSNSAGASTFPENKARAHLAKSSVVAIIAPAARAADRLKLLTSSA